MIEEKWYQQERTYGNSHGLYMEATHQPNMQARMALEILRSWVGPATENGEDRAGRARYRAMTAEEIARKACDTAQAMCAEYERRGWFVQVEDVPLRRDR